jgi:tetratricopeptide (TPR) repeat protein
MNRITSVTTKPYLATAIMLTTAFLLTTTQVSPAAPIHNAVEAKDVAQVKKILAENPKLVKAVTPGGATPLHLAAGLDDTAMIKLLLNSNPDINARTNRGDTPLHWAAAMNATQATQLLLDNGANINVRTTDGMTALQLAVKEDATSVARVLKNHTPSNQNSNAAVTFQNGEHARTTGNLDEAYRIFKLLLRQRPQDENINFALGLTCDEMKDYPQAQTAFQRVLQVNPENDLARYGLAKSLFELGHSQTAKQEFRKVLAGNPPLNIRRQIERYLNRTKKPGRKWNVSGHIDAGVFDDDNVNVGPESEAISITPVVFGSTIFTEWYVQESSLPESSDGFFSSASFAFSYDGGRKNNWQGIGNILYYQNNLNNTPDYESLYYQTSLGLRHAGKQTMFQMPVHFAHVDIGHDSLVDIYGFSPMHLYVSGTDGGMYWITSSTLEFRDYTKINDRDGIYAAAGETIRSVFGEKGHSMYMGFSVLHDRTDSPVYEYVGTSLDIGTDIKLPMRITLYGRLRYKKTDYAQKEELALEKRRDTQNQFVAGIGINITQSLGIDMNHRHTENSSSFPLYQYERDVSTISMFFRF